MPVISAGAEAQEAERGWASSPAGQTSGQWPQSSPQSRWGSQASELCLRGMEGSGWTAAGGPFRFQLPPPPHPPPPPPRAPPPPPTSQRSPPTSTPILGLPSYSVASAPPSPPGCLPGPMDRHRHLPTPACHWPAVQPLSPSPVTASTGLLSPKVAEGRCKEGWKCLSRTPLLSPPTTAPGPFPGLAPVLGSSTPSSSSLLGSQTLGFLQPQAWPTGLVPRWTPPPLLSLKKRGS